MNFLQVRCQQKCSRATEDRGLDSKGGVISAELGLERPQGKMECHPPGRHRITEVRGCARGKGHRNGKQGCERG